MITATGTVSGTFAGVPDGTVVGMAGCSGAAPTLRLEYSAHAVTATVVTSGARKKPAHTSFPAIQGESVEGQTLTDVAAGWTGSPGSFIYQWEDCTSIGQGVFCSAVTGAEEASYTLRPSDLGKMVRVREIATNGFGSSQPVYSGPTAPVTTASAPTNVSPPTITGNPVEGEVLFEHHGSWTGLPSSYLYQWERCDSDGNNCTGIPGAEGSEYRLEGADVGHKIRVAEEARNKRGTSLPAYSTSRGSVTTPTPPPPPHVPPSSINSPVVTGLPRVGEVLTCQPGVWGVILLRPTRTNG